MASIDKELTVSVINVKEAKDPIDTLEPEFTDLQRSAEPKKETEIPEIRQEDKTTPIISTEPAFVFGRPARHGEILVNYPYYGGYSGYPYYGGGYGYAHRPRVENRTREPCLDCCGNPCCCCGQPCCYV